ncbi:MAG: hypothetical protein H6983_16405 [Ectothiorhodospiraceae bacterium]|nr:hypothetical protein [Ectothiorhodospiraceae bacterium]
MLRRFVDGLVFGAGVALAFSIVQWTLAYYVAPRFLGESLAPVVTVGLPSGPQLDARGRVAGPDFDELPLEQRIQRASVIAVARYESGDSEHLRAVFTEILKRAPGTEFNYAIGDEFPHARVVPRENVHYGDGLVVFFEGSPARMRMSMTFAEERILGLGDMRLERFRQMSRESNL